MTILLALYIAVVALFWVNAAASVALRYSEAGSRFRFLLALLVSLPAAYWLQ